MTEGPLGGAAFNNEFGRPNLGGYFRVYEQTVAGVRRGYHKPIMIAGGLGAISDGQAKKLPFGPGTLLVQLGGPGHAHRHGRRRGQFHGRRHATPRRSTSIRCSAATPRSSAVRRRSSTTAGRSGRGATRSWRSTTSAPAASATPSPNSSTAPGRVPPSTCGACRWRRAAWRPRRSGATRARSATCWPSNPDLMPLFEQMCERERCPFAVVGVATAEPRTGARGRRRRRARHRHAAGGAAGQAAEECTATCSACARPSRRST